MAHNRQMFPSPEEADEDGVLAFSRDVNTDMLLEAYSRGIFPWPLEEGYIIWFSPPRRAIIDFERFRIPQGVARELKNKDFTFRVNHDFEQVIRSCAGAERRDGDGTWITPKMIEAYIEFNRLGYAWSFETLDGSGDVVGGLYGVKINHFFAGESMFYKASGASKFALIRTVAYLRENFGVKWIDAQVQNPFLRRFGTCELDRAEYIKKLEKALTD